MLDCLIIGAGPAGLTAAIYLRRNDLDVLVLEKGVPGGAVVNTASVQNYPGYEDIDGPNLASNMYSQALALKAKVKREEAQEINKVDDYFVIKTNKNTYEARNVILALGLTHKKLGLLKEEKFTSRGISWCAICDGYLYKDKEVAVVGGGNSSLEESLYLANICSKVHLIHRRDEFRADSSIVEKVKLNTKIEMHLNSRVVDILGDNEFEGLVLENKEGNKSELKCSALFEFIGYEPKTAFLSNLDICNEYGFIIVDKEFMTKHEGLYAVGDCIDKKVRQIATAVGDAAYASTVISTKVR